MSNSLTAIDLNILLAFAQLRETEFAETGKWCSKDSDSANDDRRWAQLAWNSFHRAIELHQDFTAIAGEYRNDVAQTLSFSGYSMQYADRYGITQNLDLRGITSIELNTYPST